MPPTPSATHSPSSLHQATVPPASPSPFQFGKYVPHISMTVTITILLANNVKQFNHEGLHHLYERTADVISFFTVFKLQSVNCKLMQLKLLFPSQVYHYIIDSNLLPYSLRPLPFQWQLIPSPFQHRLPDQSLSHLLSHSLLFCLDCHLLDGSQFQQPQELTLIHIFFLPHFQLSCCLLCLCLIHLLLPHRFSHFQLFLQMCRRQVALLPHLVQFLLLHSHLRVVLHQERVVTYYYATLGKAMKLQRAYQSHHQLKLNTKVVCRQSRNQAPSIALAVNVRMKILMVVAITSSMWRAQSRRGVRHNEYALF